MFLTFRLFANSLASLLLVASALAQQPPRVSTNEVTEQPDNGAIRGSVVDDAGKTVAGAVITFRNYSQVQNRNSQTTSKTDGSFSVDQLPAGDYTQCVQVPKSDYLDDCQWNVTFLPRIVTDPSPTKTGVTGQTGKIILVSDLPHSSERIVVPPGGTNATQKLTVHKGARVVFRFIDSARLITDQTHLIVGALTANGMFVPAQRTATGAITQFDVVVPFETRVRLAARSLTLKAFGSSGSLNLAIGTPIEVKIGKNDPPLIFNFNVTANTK